MSLTYELAPIESATLEVTKDALVIAIPLVSLAAWAHDK